MNAYEKWVKEYDAHGRAFWAQFQPTGNPATINRVEDVIVDEQATRAADGTLALCTEAVGYVIHSARVHYRKDALNLPAYRHEVLIVARWSDNRRVFSETFYGYGPAWEAAEAQAQAGYEAWRARMNRIGAA